MNAAEARALLFQRKLNYEDFAGKLPGIPELDGQLGIIELPASDSVQLEKLAKGPDGDIDESLHLAGQICKSLVLRETKERLFSDTDIAGVAGFGLSVLFPIGQRIKALSGLDDAAIEQAKKN